MDSARRGGHDEVRHGRGGELERRDRARLATEMQARTSPSIPGTREHGEGAVRRAGARGGEWWPRLGLLSSGEGGFWPGSGGGSELAGGGAWLRRNWGSG